MSKNDEISFSKLFWYVVIFSIIGLFVETAYGYFTTGVLESRKGLLIGPFCPVYGVGAMILILATYRYKDSYLKVFLQGALIGGIVEYVLSFILEAIYGIRFWEYSYMKYHLNGRICIVYSIFWGILALILVKFAKPLIDKMIDKIPKRKVIEIVLLSFLILDALVTIWSIITYQNRVIFNKTSKGVRGKIEDTFFSNEVMLKTFPNLRYKTEDGKEIYIRDLI